MHQRIEQLRKLCETLLKSSEHYEGVGEPEIAETMRRAYRILKSWELTASAGWEDPQDIDLVH